MESKLEVTCKLCLRICSENAIEEVTYERFKEATEFVFTFEISCNVDSNGSKVCRRCVYCILEFYEYARQVKANQEAATSFETIVKEEPVLQEQCSIKLEPLQTTSDYRSLTVVETATKQDSSDCENINADATSDDLDADSSAHSEHSDTAPARRGKRNGETKYNCTRCSESFSHKLSLKRHMKKHLDCKVCDTCFPDKDSLRDHIKSTHKNDRMVMCDKCGKMFKKCNLKTHYDTHHTAGPLDVFDCNVCLKSFHNLATMRSHIKAIHKEAGRTFKCEICQKVYDTSRSLRGHKSRVHCERKYSCTICNKLFKRVVNFKEHMAAHTGVTLYECDVCGHKFNSNANMYAHIKRKHPVEWSEKQKERLLGRRRRENNELT